MFVHFKEKLLYWNELGKKILFFILLTILVLPATGYAKTESTNNENKHKTNVINGEITPEHLVESIVLFDEIYDINISEGHYRVSAELMMTWEADTTQFLSEFGDKIIHGEKLELFLNKNWHPEFIIANAENPRTTHYKTLDVIDGKYELFERFEADLSIDAIMPRYPFGELDLFMEMAAFSGSQSLMRWKPVNIFIGHDDAHHVVVKGNWEVKSTGLEEVTRSSLNHGGKERFSYLISHVNVAHNAVTALQKILLPLSSIILLSLVVNHLISATSLADTKNRKLSEDYGINVGVQITLFLVIPALKFSLASDMPSTHYLNFTDGVFILATLIVAMNLILGIISLSLAVNGNVQKSVKLESYSKIGSPIIMLMGFAFVLFLTSANTGH